MSQLEPTRPDPGETQYGSRVPPPPPLQDNPRLIQHYDERDRPDGEPQAVVRKTQMLPWLYSIGIEHGLKSHHVRHVLGWERAMRKARRELQRYQETRAPEKRRWVVRNDFPRADVSGRPPFSQVQPPTPPKGLSGISPSQDGSR